MYVGRVMRRDLVTVPPDTSLVKAKDIITEKRIKHILVVENDKLLGIVSDRDLRQSSASPATTLSAHELNYLLKRLTVDKIMVKKVVSISPDTTVERAALIMQQNRISALPVLKNDKLVGIITTTDVMEVLLEAIGIDSDSSRLVVLVQDRVGVVAEVAMLMKEHQINIRSFVSWPMRLYPGVYQLIMRVSAKDSAKAVSLLTKAGFKVLTEYIEDLTAYMPAA